MDETKRRFNILHAKENKYQVFITDGDNDDEFYILGVDSFEGFGRKDNQVIATHINSREDVTQEEMRKTRMLDLKEDCKSLGIDCERVNWTPIRI